MHHGDVRHTTLKHYATLTGLVIHIPVLSCGSVEEGSIPSGILDDGHQRDPGKCETWFSEGELYL